MDNFVSLNAEDRNRRPIDSWETSLVDSDEEFSLFVRQNGLIFACWHCHLVHAAELGVFIAERQAEDSRQQGQQAVSGIRRPPLLLPIVYRAEHAPYATRPKSQENEKEGHLGIMDSFKSRFSRINYTHESQNAKKAATSTIIGIEIDATLIGFGSSIRPVPSNRAIKTPTRETHLSPRLLGAHPVLHKKPNLNLPC